MIFYHILLWSFIEQQIIFSYGLFFWSNMTCLLNLENSHSNYHQNWTSEAWWPFFCCLSWFCFFPERQIVATLLLNQVFALKGILLLKHWWWLRSIITSKYEVWYRLKWPKWSKELFKVEKVSHHVLLHALGQQVWALGDRRTRQCCPCWPQKLLMNWS